MSNRQQRRASRPAGKPSFMESLAAVAERAKEEQGNDTDEDEVPEAGGTLPKPNTQQLRGTFIRWTWIPVPRELHKAGATVTATYSRTTRTYQVEPEVDLSNAVMTGDEAKAFGEALLSAWQWQYIWQQNVGQFLVDADTPETTVENLPVAPYDGQSPASAEALDGND